MLTEGNDYSSLPVLKKKRGGTVHASKYCLLENICESFCAIIPLNHGYKCRHESPLAELPGLKNMLKDT